MDYLGKAKEIISVCFLIPIEKIPDSGTLNDVVSFDSLSFEALITQIEEFVGHEVDVLDLMELRSVESLAKLLKKETK